MIPVVQHKVGAFEALQVDGVKDGVVTKYGASSPDEDDGQTMVLRRLDAVIRLTDEPRVEHKDTSSNENDAVYPFHVGQDTEQPLV